MANKTYPTALGCPPKARANRRGAALALAVVLCGWTQFLPAQEAAGEDLPALPRDHYRNGEETLRAFAPISKATRNSIVKLNVNGETVALGTVMDASGLALTKASEIKPGQLTCWLASDHEVKAEVVGVDDDEDVALVRVHTTGLKPIVWATGNVAEGQWAVTPGIAETPHAVGIISALPRHIPPQRAFIGVHFDFESSQPTIRMLVAGMSAEKAGLKPGDVIAAVNGAAVSNRQEVVRILSEFREGQTVTVRVRRGPKEFNADLKLSVPRPEEAAADYYPRRRGVFGVDVSRRAQGFEQAIEHDTVLQPWLCGGPLVNLDGQAIGLNIARAGRVATYALPPALVQRIFDRLKAQLRQPEKAAAR